MATQQTEDAVPSQAPTTTTTPAEVSSSTPPSSPPPSWKKSVEAAVDRADEVLEGAAAGAAAAVLNASVRAKKGLTNGTTPSPSSLPPSATPLTRARTDAPAQNLVVLYAVSAVVGLVVLVLLKRLLGGGRKRREKTVLVGLPSSGKTALFSQLTAGRMADSRTSMIANTGVLRLENGQQATGLGTVLVDVPGHRRLRNLLYPHLEEATSVVVAVDAVTIHDDQHEGALAVSALLLNVIESPAFYGVKRLLIVATKRDEVTSYSIKAVRKLLEAAMVRTLVARQGELNRVDKVIDVKGGVVTAGKNRHGAGKKAYVLDLDEHGGFDFGQLGLEEVSFAEASSLHATATAAGAGNMSVEPVRQFILHH